MALRTRTALKAYFETGDTPTQAEFADLIDSILNRTDDTLDQIAEGSAKKSVTAAEKSSWNARVTQAELASGLSPKLEATDIAEKQNFTQLKIIAGDTAWQLVENLSAHQDIEEPVTISLGTVTDQKVDGLSFCNIFKNASGGSVTVTYDIPNMDTDTAIEASTKAIAVANGSTLIVTGHFYYDGTNVRIAAKFNNVTP